MRRSMMSACCVVLFLALSSALPMAQPAVSQDAVTLVELLPAQAQESLHTLSLGEPKSDASARDKRTVGFLRETFPSITEIIDRKIQTITRFVFRLIGRLVLGGAGGGAGTTTETKDGDGAIGASSSSASGSGGNGRRISITLPTYPPSLDDDEDEDEDDEDSSPAASSNDVLAAASDTVASTVDPPAALRSSDNTRRVARATADQENAASDAVADDTTADDSENRDKRFLFGFGGGEGGAGSSAGGSGNFLFDIIRGTADRTARTAGNIYRMVAGTSEDHFTFAAAPKSFGTRSAAGSSGFLGGSLGAGAYVSHSNYGDDTSGSKTSSSLIAGSGNTEEVSDGHETTGGSGLGYSAVGAQVAAEVPQLGHSDKDDGYTSGIPGPITRLFIIANRGVSNLIQDLILRLAQTSERIVNFKARLITSVI